MDNEQQSIVDVISTHVKLNKFNNNYIGNCPFHKEITDSFTVFTKTNQYYCFGCGKNGGAVSFLNDIKKLEAST